MLVDMSAVSVMVAYSDLLRVCSSPCREVHSTSLHGELREPKHVGAAFTFLMCF